jgi:hypothetical protein
LTQQWLFFAALAVSADPSIIDLEICQSPIAESSAKGKFGRCRTSFLWSWFVNALTPLIPRFVQALIKKREKTTYSIFLSTTYQVLAPSAKLHYAVAGIHSSA